MRNISRLITNVFLILKTHIDSTINLPSRVIRVSGNLYCNTAKLFNARRSAFLLKSNLTIGCIRKVRYSKPKHGGSAKK